MIGSLLQIGSFEIDRINQFSFEIWKGIDQLPQFPADLTLGYHGGRGIARIRKIGSDGIVASFL